MLEGPKKAVNDVVSRAPGRGSWDTGCSQDTVVLVTLGSCPREDAACALPGGSITDPVVGAESFVRWPVSFMLAQCLNFLEWPEAVFG